MTGFQADRSIRNLFLRHPHYPFITGLFNKGPQPDGRSIRRQHPAPVSALMTVGAALFISMFICTAGAGAVLAGENSDAERTQSAPPVTNMYTENEWGFVEGSMDVSHGIPEDAIGRLERIREKGRLVVGTEPYFPPQEFIDPTKTGQEQYVGADIELAKLIAERMGVELEIKPMDFSELLTAAAEGTVDLAISGLAFTPGRAASMELSKGYHYTTADAATGILIRKVDRHLIRGVENLADKNIVAQGGSLQEMQMAENVSLYHQFRRLSSMQDVYNALMDGTADAGAADIETALQFIDSNPSCGLMLLEGISYHQEEQYQGDRVAGPKDDLQLMYFVNGVIDEVLDSGMYSTWFADYSDYARKLNLE